MFRKGKCFGSSNVGAKGEIVIPAEARREFGIEKGDKMLVFGRPERGMIVLIEASRVSRWLSETLAELTELSASLGVFDEQKGD